jgi:hypothetical protein
MKKRVNIICIYWVGDFRGRDFCENDVIRLRETVNKHIDRPYTFYCLTNKMDADIPAEKIALSHPEWPGWWAKVELHRPDLPKGRTLYLDLDSHVINNLQPILDYTGNLVMFNSRAAKVNKNGVVHKYQAAVMLFDPGSTSWIYDKFSKDPIYWMNKYRSEQDLMGEWIPDQPTFPDHWMVKLSKLINKPDRLIDKTIIVTGQPKLDSFRDPVYMPWLKELAR